MRGGGFDGEKKAGTGVTGWTGPAWLVSVATWQRQAAVRVAGGDEQELLREAE